MNIFDRYQMLRKDIERATKVIGHDSSSILLLAVSKGHSLEHILHAYEGGCQDYGESRVQEALEKISAGPKNIHWHFIGTIQKNKVRKMIGKFHLLHSVDSHLLAEKISRDSEEVNEVTPVLFQVNTSMEKTKHGFKPKELEEKFSDLMRLKGISAKGLMTIAPLTDDEQTIRHCFSDLRKLRNRLQTRLRSGERFNELSMGMTHDWKIAIQEGATILRIGSGIFGKREKT